MNQHPRISPDDPRLTAYALNEMEPAERAEFEQLLGQDPAAQAQVREIAATTGDLTRALAAEPLPADEPVHVGAATGHAPARARDTLPKVHVFPYYWISGLAAACFAVAFVVWQTKYQAPQYKQYMEIDLQQARSAPSESTATPSASSPETRSNADVITVALPPVAPAAETEKKADDLLVVQLPIAPLIEPGAKLSDMTTPPVHLVAPSAAGAPANEPKSVDQLFADEAARPAVTGDLTRAATIRPTPAPLASSVVAGNLAASSGSPTQGYYGGTAGAIAGGAAGSVGDAQGYVAANTLAGTRLPKTEETIQLDAFMVSAERREDAAGRAYRMGATAIPPARAKASARVARPIGQDLSVSFEHPMPEVTPPIMALVEHNTEAYDRITDNPFTAVAYQPLSTFSIDVDTASYANLRRFLQGGQRPPRDAVRIEELVNYFPYDYAGPVDRDMPFAAAMEVASAPWKPEHRLVRIGLKGREIPAAERPAANLVFLIDVSGSMRSPNKLPLVKQSLRLLVEQLRAEDRVALAVYAGRWDPLESTCRHASLSIL